MNIPITQLVPHPDNSNVMPARLFDKLVAHLRRTGRYPPLIVRPGDGGRYQLLDGHHRCRALRRLGHTHARCEVWDIGDDEALLLLATLNRLEGRDDPRKRAALLRGLAERIDTRRLGAQVPEDGGRLGRLLALEGQPPAPRPPVPLDQMPVSLHFFLRPAQKRAVERRLAALGGTREAALLRLAGVDEGLASGEIETHAP